MSCNIAQGSTTVTKFCESGCCDNNCCSSSSVDTRTLAIALSVIFGVILLILLIILIIYYCWQRKKKIKTKPEKRQLHDMEKGEKDKSGHAGRYTSTREIQTGDPNPYPGDNILLGRSSRWVSKFNKRTPSGRFWNRTVQPMENFSQTSYDDIQRSAQTPLGNPATKVNSQPPTNSSMGHHKGYKTPTPRPSAYDPKNTQYLANWTPKAPWKPSQQQKSLSKNSQVLNANSTYTPKEIEPFYTVHRCPPDSSHGSEYSGNQSVTSK